MKTSVTVAEIPIQPVTVQEAKQQLTIPANLTAHDVKIRGIIQSSVQQWEDDTQALTTSRQVDEQLCVWPTASWRFYWRPVIDIIEITYFDEDNVSQTLPDTEYSLDAPNRQLFPAVGATWPAVAQRWDAITISYNAGAAVCSPIAIQAILMQIDVQWELRGTTKDKDASIRAYEHLVNRYQRATYP